MWIQGAVPRGPAWVVGGDKPDSTTTAVGSLCTGFDDRP